jgi:MEMO1 family protein
MSLVFAAITPHPPILIPNIGRNETKKLAKTTASYNTLEEELYASHPDVIVIISPHGSYFPDVFTLNFCSDYTADFKEFGDIETKLEFKGDFEIAHRLRDATKRKYVPAAMISEPRLDHGSAVPLYFLTNHLPQQKIVQLGFCNLDYKAHVDFGQVIKEQIFSVNRRIAVIASGDLSHALSTDAPAGFNKRGPEFDAKIREMLMNGNYSGLLQFEKNLTDGAAECGLRSILILLGILQGVHVKYRELSYEAPFGVGYLTASFTL